MSKSGKATGKIEPVRPKVQSITHIDRVMVKNGKVSAPPPNPTAEKGKK